MYKVGDTIEIIGNQEWKGWIWKPWIHLIGTTHTVIAVDKHIWIEVNGDRFGLCPTSIKKVNHQLEFDFMRK